ncbi:MAG: LysM peptidoglycan-binding domain-containing protein, partial [Opitutaceae bacterium]|nr:LysM peptidoglycan-binding domain-containing protein [Opitutaceae bacterium]
MKILQIFGAVIAVHLLAFVFIFASPGCQSGPRNVPTPDATVPAGQPAAPAAYDPGLVTPQPVDLHAGGTTYLPAPAGGHASPTRPGSANAVAVTPAKPAADVAPVTTYTVARGDSLWSIAKRNNLTVAELAKANNVSTGTTLQPGKKLIIPGKPGAAPVAAPAPVATADKPAAAARSGEVKTHTVAVGESLGVIARRYGISVGELAAANTITDLSKVRAGQTLVIPGYKGVTINKAAPAPAKAAPAPATEPAAPAVNTPHFEIKAPPV